MERGCDTGCQSLKKSQRGHSSNPVTKLSGRKHVGGLITKDWQGIQHFVAQQRQSGAPLM